MELNLKLVHPDYLPTYGSAEASGMDLKARLDKEETLNPGERRLIPTGVMMELEPGFEGQIRPRSGLAVKYGICIVNTPGTIDSDYRGEICVNLVNLGYEPFVIEPKMRIAQLVIAPVIRANINITNELNSTERGDNGHGSTGTK